MVASTDWTQVALLPLLLVAGTGVIAESTDWTQMALRLLLLLLPLMAGLGACSVVMAEATALPSALNFAFPRIGGAEAETPPPPTTVLLVRER